MFWGQFLIVITLLAAFPVLFIPQISVGPAPSQDQLNHQGMVTSLKCLAFLAAGVLGTWLVFSDRTSGATKKNRRAALVTMAIFSFMALIGTGFPFNESMGVWQRSKAAFSDYCQQNGLKESAYFRALRTNKLGYSYSEYALREPGAKAEFIVKTWWFGPVSVQKAHPKT